MEVLTSSGWVAHLFSSRFRDFVTECSVGFAVSVDFFEVSGSLALNVPFFILRSAIERSDCRDFFDRWFLWLAMWDGLLVHPLLGSDPADYLGEYVRWQEAFRRAAGRENVSLFFRVFFSCVF